MKICLKNNYSRSTKKRAYKKERKRPDRQEQRADEAVCIDPVTVEMDAKSRRMRV